MAFTYALTNNPNGFRLSEVCDTLVPMTILPIAPEVPPVPLGPLLLVECTHATAEFHVNSSVSLGSRMNITGYQIPDSCVGSLIRASGTRLDLPR